MSWEVEFTDEFEAWWEKLTEEEQESVAATVGLLEARGPDCSHRTAAPSMAPNMATCANCAPSMPEDRIARCMPSPPGERRFC